MKNKIFNLIKENIETAQVYLQSEKEINILSEVIKKIVNCYKKNKKLIIFGNGGSAADAQHFVAELVGRFKKERKPLKAISLTTNTSTITALANDYGYDVSFSRQLEAFAEEGDVVVGLSTSGNSINVLKAIELAKSLGCITVGLTGEKGGKLREMVDYCISVPTNDTPRIQELHVMIIHIICDLVEQELFK